MNAILIVLLTVSAESPSVLVVPPSVVTALERQTEAINSLASQVVELQKRLELLEGKPLADSVLPATPQGTVRVVHPQTGLVVNAKSVWHSYFIGRVKVIECLQRGNETVPVESVTYEGGKMPDYPPDPGPTVIRVPQPVDVYPTPGISPGMSIEEKRLWRPSR